MYKNHPLFIISAADENLGIGKDGVMPWHFKKELAHFHRITTEVDESDGCCGGSDGCCGGGCGSSEAPRQNMVIMGWTTWLSLPEKHRPLTDRKNVVLAHDPSLVAEGAEMAGSFEEALALADDTVDKIFFIGGQSVYRQTIEREDIDGVYLTRIHHAYDCDTFFPEIPARYGEPEVLGSDEENDISFDYLLYRIDLS